MANKNNLYIELEPNTNDQDLQKLSRYQNLYIKVRSSSLQMLMKVPYTSNKYLTVEIINNCKLEKENVLEKFIHAHKPDRIVVTINEKINTEILEVLDSIHYKNVAVDLYWGEAKSLKENVLKLINRFSFINHISIYPDNQSLYLDHCFCGFTRYHHNMWSKDINKYYARYDFQTIQDKQYLGIGKEAITREGHSFWKNNVPLNICKKYITIQDHIDRLNYYIPIGEEELNLYPLVKKNKYMKELETKETIQIHQNLISDLLES